MLSFSFIADSQKYMSMFLFSHATPQYLRPADTILNSIKCIPNCITFLCGNKFGKAFKMLLSHDAAVHEHCKNSPFYREFILFEWMDRGKTGKNTSSLVAVTQTHNVFISVTEKYSAMNFTNSSVY